MQIITYQAGHSGSANATKPAGPSAAEGIRRALLRTRGGAAHVANMDRATKAKAEAKPAPKVAAIQPQPKPVAKLDYSPVIKAIANQAALTGEAPAIGIKAASHPVSASPAAPVVDHAAIRSGWDSARADMLQRTGRA